MFSVFQPKVGLRKYVDAYYLLNSKELPPDLFLVPTIIRSWLVFMIEGNVIVRMEDEEITLPQISVKGPFEFPYFYRYSQSDIRCIAVQLSHAGMHELTRKPGTIFKNRYTDILEIWDDEKVIDIMNVLKSSKNHQDSIDCVEQLIEENIPPLDLLNEKSQLVIKACEKMKTSGYSISLSSLVEELCVSTKTLERAFKTVTGIPPKRYLASCFFEEIMVELMHNKRKNISELMGLPFYDFSHANKWFKKFARIAPTEFTQQEYHVLEDIIKYQNDYNANSRDRI